MDQDTERKLESCREIQDDIAGYLPPLPHEVPLEPHLKHISLLDLYYEPRACQLIQERFSKQLRAEINRMEARDFEWRKREGRGH